LKAITRFKAPAATPDAQKDPQALLADLEMMLKK